MIKRGDQLVTKVNIDLAVFRATNNYFVRAIDDELRVLNVLLNDLREEVAKPQNVPINQAFLQQAELQLNRHENTLSEMLLLAEQANKNPQYQSLLNMVDALLARAYEDIGRLVSRGHTDQTKTINDQVKAVEELERYLKSLDYQHSTEEAQKVVENILTRERLIEEDLYRIEHLSSESSQF